MKGIVKSVDERLYIEYIVEGNEQDEVIKKQMLLTFTDRYKVEVEQVVEFEVCSHYTISDEPIAKIK